MQGSSAVMSNQFSQGLGAIRAFSHSAPLQAIKRVNNVIPVQDDCEGDEHDSESLKRRVKPGQRKRKHEQRRLRCRRRRRSGAGHHAAHLGSRKRFPNCSSAYFGRGPRIAYRTTKPPVGPGGFSNQRRSRAFACLNCSELPETGPVPIRRKLTCRPRRPRNVPT